MTTIMACIFTPTLQCNIIEHQAKVVEFMRLATQFVKGKIATETTL